MQIIDQRLAGAELAQSVGATGTYAAILDPSKCWPDIVKAIFERDRLAASTVLDAIRRSGNRSWIRAILMHGTRYLQDHLIAAYILELDPPNAYWICSSTLSGALLDHRPDLLKRLDRPHAMRLLRETPRLNEEELALLAVIAA